ncbi:MAG TPA: AMP-binding protein, partial [Armatimonadota bacterium]|nr:AMP-binding protein [Armatimonadota bacterium]
DRLSFTHSCSFIVSVVEIFGGLLNGGATCPLDLRNEGVEAMREWLVEAEITVMSWVPTAFRRFAETLSGAEEFPRLRVISMGGEAPTPRDAELYRTHFSPGCALATVYGVTETGAVLANRLEGELPAGPPVLRAGYPTFDKEVLLLDDGGAEVAPGEVGEIAVRSRYLSPGYWRNPTLTEAQFRLDPKDPGRRIYHTGDLGRLLPDGCLEHLGRKDFQVKIRGHRVETGEIEAALLQLPGVAEAVVAARKGASDEERLVAYLVPAPGTAPTVTALRRLLAERLPPAMLPAGFVFLPALPLLPNGKVDRRALPEPDAARPAVEPQFVAPRTPLEEQLARIWRSVLEVESVGVQDGFFELGGNSLLAARMFAEVARECGTKLPLTTLLRAPTVERLADVLEGDEDTAYAPGLVPIQPDGSRSPLYLIAPPGGSAIVFRDLARHLGPDQPVYGLQAAEVDGKPVPYVSGVESARHYLEEIRALQPSGPYCLMGYSYGGIIAFEMACRLHAQGEPVAFLGLLDTLGPRARKLPAP